MEKMMGQYVLALHMLGLVPTSDDQDAALNPNSRCEDEHVAMMRDCMAEDGWQTSDLLAIQDGAPGLGHQLPHAQG
jgi:hypothetical protein